MQPQWTGASSLLKMFIFLEMCSFYQWNDSQLISFQLTKGMFIYFEIVWKLVHMKLLTELCKIFNFHKIMYFSLRHGQNTSASDRMWFCLRNNLQQFWNPTVSACFPTDTLSWAKYADYLRDCYNQFLLLLLFSLNWSIWLLFNVIIAWFVTIYSTGFSSRTIVFFVEFSPGILPLFSYLLPTVTTSHCGCWLLSEFPIYNAKCLCYFQF